MNEKKNKEHLKNENEYLKKILDDINTNTWNLYDLFQEDRRSHRMRDIRWEVCQIMYNLGHNVGGSYGKKGKLKLYSKHYDDFNLNWHIVSRGEFNTRVRRSFERPFDEQ